MLRGQMSPWQLESVLDVHRSLPLKFHQIRSVTAEILLTLSLCGWVGGGGWWWIKVIFMSNPTFELSWGWVVVVTKMLMCFDAIEINQILSYCCPQSLVTASTLLVIVRGVKYITFQNISCTLIGLEDARVWMVASDWSSFWVITTQTCFWLIFALFLNNEKFNHCCQTDRW